MVFFEECALHFRILVTETFNCRFLPEVVQADSKTKNIDHDCKTTNNEDEMRTQRESWDFNVQDSLRSSRFRFLQAKRGKRARALGKKEPKK